MAESTIYNLTDNSLTTITNDSYQNIAISGTLGNGVLYISVEKDTRKIPVGTAISPGLYSIDILEFAPDNILVELVGGKNPNCSVQLY